MGGITHAQVRPILLSDPAHAHNVHLHAQPWAESPHLPYTTQAHVMGPPPDTTNGHTNFLLCWPLTPSCCHPLLHAWRRQDGACLLPPPQPWHPRCLPRPQEPHWHRCSGKGRATTEHPCCPVGRALPIDLLGDQLESWAGWAGDSLSKAGCTWNGPLLLPHWWRPPRQGWPGRQGPREAQMACAKLCFRLHAVFHRTRQ